MYLLLDLTNDHSASDRLPSFAEPQSQLTPNNDLTSHHTSSPSCPSLHASLTPIPKITIIAIWNPRPGRPPQPYLANFFASVEANAPDINLLFVVLDRDNYGCDKRLSPATSKNIQEICFKPEEYWALHADYLCDHWQCSDSEKSRLLQLLIERGPDDNVRLIFLQAALCTFVSRSES